MESWHSICSLEEYQLTDDKYFLRNNLTCCFLSNRCWLRIDCLGRPLVTRSSFNKPWSSSFLVVGLQSLLSNLPWKVSSLLSLKDLCWWILPVVSPLCKQPIRLERSLYLCTVPSLLLMEPYSSILVQSIAKPHFWNQLCNCISYVCSMSMACPRRWPFPWADLPENCWSFPIIFLTEKKTVRNRGTWGQCTFDLFETLFPVSIFWKLW